MLRELAARKAATEKAEKAAAKAAVASSKARPARGTGPAPPAAPPAPAAKSSKSLPGSIGHPSWDEATSGNLPPRRAEPLSSTKRKSMDATLADVEAERQRKRQERQERQEAAITSPIAIEEDSGGESGDSAAAAAAAAMAAAAANDGDSASDLDGVQQQTFVPPDELPARAFGAFDDEDVASAAEDGSGEREPLCVV